MQSIWALMGTAGARKMRDICIACWGRSILLALSGAFARMSMAAGIVAEVFIAVIYSSYSNYISVSGDTHRIVRECIGLYGDTKIIKAI